MDYKQLVTKLRRWSVDYWSVFHHPDYLADEAADAIEELEKKMLNWQATADDHWDAYHHWFDAYMRDVPKWIPVTERLPDTCAPVLVCLHWGLDNDEITVSEYWRNSKASPGWGTFDPYVTHWMPLPELPKEET